MIQLRLSKVWCPTPVSVLPLYDSLSPSPNGIGPFQPLSLLPSLLLRPPPPSSFSLFPSPPSPSLLFLLFLLLLVFPSSFELRIFYVSLLSQLTPSLHGGARPERGRVETEGSRNKGPRGQGPGVSPRTHRLRSAGTSSTKVIRETTTFGRGRIPDHGVTLPVGSTPGSKTPTETVVDRHTVTRPMILENSEIKKVVLCPDH